MKTYKIDNLAINAPAEADIRGYNVHDYFENDANAVRFATKEAAEEWLEDNYLGEDEYGVGVSWDIQEYDLSIEAMDISIGIYEDANRICEEITEGKHTRSEAAELLESLKQRLEDAND